MIILTAFLLSLSAVHANDDVSAYRPFNKDYSHYEKKFQTKMLKRTPLNTATLYNEDKLPKATTWGSKELMQERFEAIRDEKFLVWKKNPETLRRSSWLYPDDGCFARAALAMRNIFRWYAPMAKKVFAFGNLRVKTKNSPRGAVGWWYHVAPIVEVDKVKYVLDPAIDSKAPLTLKEWLDKMGKPEKIKVSICASGAYSPSDNCNRETDGIEARAERAQQHYLNLEYKRLVKMGRTEEL